MFLKVQLNHHPVEEASWETKKDMREKYPKFFVDKGTTPFTPYIIFPKMVKLASILTNEFHRYENTIVKKLGNVFFVLAINFPTYSRFGLNRSH